MLINSPLAPLNRCLGRSKLERSGEETDGPMRRRGLSGDLRPTQVPSAQVQCVRISHVPHRAGKIAAVRRKTKGLGRAPRPFVFWLDLHQSARASPMLLAGSTHKECRGG
jgi:hypothetical protein